MAWVSLLFAVVLAFVACDGNGPGDATATPAPVSPTPSASLPVREVTVEGNGRSERLTVEVAARASERITGLMFRQQLAEDRGMLFLFAGEEHGGFWMRNTYVPLTIAYLDANGTVVDMKDGKPLDETVLTPAKPYRMVLEVNQGWFERHGLAIGSVVKVPADLPRAE